jgi:competence protein ComEA
MGGITMHLQKRLSHILCGAGLVIALVALPATGAISQTGAAKGGPAAAAPLQAGPLDINSATVDQLRKLPGIGDAYAKRIIAGRPYSSKNQLVSKGILPQNVYTRVQSMIVASHMKK